ncbi:MAG: hypothetical protein QOC92_27 [Acidimicrobiaceae bacterium]
MAARLTVVVKVPETRYAQVGDADVAYKVGGDGPRDLVYFFGVGSHLELMWDDRLFGSTYTRLASFSRLIAFNRRGTGASDRVLLGALPTWEDWSEDVQAVMDAAGSERAALIAGQDAGPIAMLFAASHPERISALVLINSSARLRIADDYPNGFTPEFIDEWVEQVARLWGTPDLVRSLMPSAAEDAEFVDLMAMVQRASATPRSAAAQARHMADMDVRDVLPLIQAPTLILQGRSSLASIEHGRYLAAHIPGARFIETAGDDPIMNPSDLLAITDDIAEFLTGERPQVEVERILTTVLFTDIVGSTERAATLGDARWRALLDSHDRAVREQLRRFRGREIKTTGDGFMVAFDGPARAIRCATAITQVAHEIGIEARAGLHTGECEIRGDDLGGLAVHIAARVGAKAGSGEVLVSSTVKDLVVGSGLEFRERGEHDLKGVPGSWKLFAVAS